MKKKNPWLAAILNFVLPGYGFAYLGTTPLVLAGIVLLVSNLGISIIHYQHTVGMAERPLFWVFTALFNLSLAVITFALTRIFNKSIQNQG